MPQFQAWHDCNINKKFSKLAQGEETTECTLRVQFCRFVCITDFWTFLSKMEISSFDIYWPIKHKVQKLKVQATNIQQGEETTKTDFKKEKIFNY